MLTTSLYPILNHLWQSTLFAVAAGMLAFALHKNRAQTRHAVWLIASLKFLIPFSWLVSVGSHIHWAESAPAAQQAISSAAKQIAQPFAAFDGLYSNMSSGASVSGSPLPAILCAIWICGFVAVVFCWLRNWLRIRMVVRNAAPVSIQAGVRVLSSPSLIEPGVFGIFRPVLLLPAGIDGHLTPSNFETILAHELCHIRRRDNLTSLLHLVVEAVFWFHPLVWWIGARLIEERERACDEEVLRQGNQPAVYAESILKICQFYLESPVACVAGVTGSDLKKRVVRIMTQEIALRLNVGKKLLLAIAAVAAIALPLAVGAIHISASGTQAESQKAPEFEVASIKPTKAGTPGFFINMRPGGRFSATGITVKFLLEQAYDVKDSQVIGAPSWTDSERYDIDAKPDEAEIAKTNKLSPDERRQELMKMLQSLLADRFKLSLGHDTRELPVYALVVAKNGPKFHESTIKPTPNQPDAPLPPPGQGGPPRQGIRMNGRGDLTVTYVDVPMFADLLSRMVGRIVVDKTGLTGKYDFTLKWTPDEGQGMMGGPPRPDGIAPPPPDPSGPSIFTALQEQLGLKLDSQKAMTDVLVIQHVERPTEN